MKPIIKKFFLLILLYMFSISCRHKIEIPQDVFIFADDYNISKDTILKIMLINKSKTNYFITLDTCRTYDYSNFNYKINSSIILKPVIYDNGELVHINGRGFIQKTKEINKDKMDCINKEVFQSEVFYKDYIVLKNAIFLKNNCSKYIEVPFQLKHKSCYFTYDYNLEKGKKYELQLEYKMIKEITEKEISKIKLDSVHKLGYNPYYGKIVSNKILINF